MKRKILGGFAAIILTICMTGCVKFNANMDIKKDKSMDFTIIYALDTTYFGNEEIFSDQEIADLQAEGYNVEKYVDGTMKGFSLSRNVANIDLVSSENDVTYSLSGLIDNENGMGKIFKLKKGFFKNTYTAKFIFDSSDSGLTTGDEELEEEFTYDDTDSDVTYDDVYTDDTYTYDSSEDDSYDYSEDETEEDFDFGNMGNMDLSYNVTLPYKALSNNATTVSEDGKKLTWALSSTGDSTMDFQFELYNMTNIYLCALIGIALIVIIVVLVMKKKKNNNSGNNIQTLNTQGETNISKDVYQESLNSVNNQNVATTTVSGVAAGVTMAANAVQQPVVEAPVVEVQPVVEAPVVEVQPVVEAPVVEVHPVVEAPVVEVQPVVEAPVVEVQPVVEAPVVEAPVVEVQPVVEAPVVEVQPVVEAPVVEVQPVVEAPVVEVQPVVEAPAEEAHTTEVMDLDV